MENIFELCQTMEILSWRMNRPVENQLATWRLTVWRLLLANINVLLNVSLKKVCISLKTRDDTLSVSGRAFSAFLRTRRITGQLHGISSRLPIESPPCRLPVNAKLTVLKWSAHSCTLQ